MGKRNVSPQDTSSYKITGLSAGKEKKIQTHPHILPQTPHVCINHTYFVSMPF